MAHPTIIDLASRTTAMADKPKRKWVQGATENAHGQFRRRAEAAGETTRQFAKEKDGAPGLLGKQARLAETLIGLPHAKKRLRDTYRKKD